MASANNKKQTVSRKRRELKKVDKGQVHIQSTFNNTLITVTDLQGNVISWSSAGSLNFKGSRKGTPFAAQMACETALKAAKDHGLRSVEVYVKGPGAGETFFLPAPCTPGGVGLFSNGHLPV